jgi:hypothetical protein
MNDVSIDVGSAIPYLVDRVLTLFGKDQEAKDISDRLTKQCSVAVRYASTVQCVGMDRPIPIQNIYQPSRLLKSEHDTSTSEIQIWQLLKAKQDFIVRAHAGHGKTVLAHWLFFNMVGGKEFLPFLFTLRWPGAIEDLKDFVKHAKRMLKSRTLIIPSKQTLVVIVDGYDEIPLQKRKEVSQALRDFATLQLGSFLLTCRSHYDVIDLNAPCYHIAPFSREDALGYVTTFLQAYGSNYSPKQLVAELVDHRFEDFLQSPLMLALVCVLKTGPMPTLPRNTVGLIRRAVDTLTFRWDEKKGITREGQMPLDGEERIRCLMRIAHDTDYIDDEASVFRAIEEHLRRLQQPNINTGKLLDELVQWYGIFMPIEEGQWSFVHRTIHDFLAARYWVESGLYARARPDYGDEARVAYAACLVPDATELIERSLSLHTSLAVLIECLRNNAAFDPLRIAAALPAFFLRQPAAARGLSMENRIIMKSSLAEGVVSADADPDFFRLCSDQLLTNILFAGLRDKTTVHTALIAYALSEMARRKPSIITNMMRNQVRTHFSLPKMIFRVRRSSAWHRFRL